MQPRLLTCISSAPGHSSTDHASRTVWHVNADATNNARSANTDPATTTTPTNINSVPNSNSVANINSCASNNNGAMSAEEVRRNIKQRDEAMARATQSHHLMITAATRVWEELYITKKPAIEEVSSAQITRTHLYCGSVIVISLLNRLVWLRVVVCDGIFFSNMQR